MAAAVGGVTSGDEAALVRTAADLYLLALPVLQFRRDLHDARTRGVGHGSLTHDRTPAGGPWADPTTLLSHAWLDLSAGPVLLVLPQVPPHAYVGAELLDPLGRSVVLRAGPDAPRRWAVLAPGSPRPAPAGAERVEAPAAFVRLVVRASVGDVGGPARVHRLQDRCELLTADNRGTPAPLASVPPRDEDEASGSGLLDHLGAALDTCVPATEEEQDLWSRARWLLDVRRRGPDRRAAVERGAALGRARLQDLVARREAVDPGDDGDWFARTVVPRALRATTDPLAPPRSEVLGVELPPSGASPARGRRTHHLVLGPGEPPARDLWTLTGYRAPSGEPAVSRTARASVIGSGSPDALRGPDEALTVVVQPDPPTHALPRHPWLPVPDAPFRLVLRLYGPAPLAAHGEWVPPTLRPIS